MTVACTTAESYVSDTASRVGAAAQFAASQKIAKYNNILTPSNLLLFNYMGYLMILLMIFLTLFVAKSLLVLVILTNARFYIKGSLTL